MGKGRFFGSSVALVALVLAASWWGGCGTSNDQGISFRAIGFFQDGQGTKGDTGQFVPLACTPPVLSFIGLQNNMVQGIETQRVDLSYRVTGGSLSIPNNSEALALRLGPSSSQEPDNAPKAFAQITMVNGQLLDFLNRNRNRLPDLPFTMIVNATAVGVTDSGDEIVTNRIGWPVDFQTDDHCNSSGGSGSPTPAGTPAATPSATP